MIIWRTATFYNHVINSLFIGNATEKALLELVKGCMPNRLHIKKGREVLFSSERKYSITEVSGDINGAFVKGAPEKILKRCRRFYDSGGSVAALESVHGLSARIDEMAQRCERVIALAVADEFSNSEIPDNLILIGLVGIRDDLRPDVKGSVSEVKRAGIQVLMITGDKKETAVAIAKEAGIVESSRDVVLTSDDLQRMSDDEVSGILPSVRVIARALPTDKSRLVRIAQQKGMVAGMTGDGVNDLAALRRADVGFAMGSGTDVAKEAGDIVILDDNFSSVKKAVLFGRTIYNSIKRFITFQLTINVAAVSVSVLGPIIGVEKPLASANRYSPAVTHSAPCPSSRRMRRTVGFGSARTGNQARNPALHEKALRSRAARVRSCASS